MASRAPSSSSRESVSSSTEMIVPRTSSPSSSLLEQALEQALGGLAAGALARAALTE